MIDNFNIDKSLSEDEIYKSLLPQIESLLNPNEPLISNLANVTAVLKESFDKISWVGFYFLKDNKLFLGPFQGKVACTIIELGKGVCGSSAFMKETKIVEDVESGFKRVMEVAAVKNINRINNKAIEMGKEPKYNLDNIANKFSWVKADDEKGRIIIILVDEELGY